MSTEAVIRVLEEQRYAAVLKQDFTAFAALCHKDLRCTHSSGGVDTLETYLEKCEAGYYVYHQIEHPIDSIIIVDNTTVVLGQMRAKITAANKSLELNNQCLALWVNTEGQWKFLAYQPTPILQ